MPNCIKTLLYAPLARVFKALPSRERFIDFYVDSLETHNFNVFNASSKISFGTFNVSRSNINGLSA